MVKKIWSELVDAAYERYRFILAREMKGSDAEPAMRRIQAKLGLDYWKQWSLKYRRKATHEFCEQVRQAYLSTLEQSVRRDLETLKIEKAKSGNETDLADLITEAENLLARIQAKKVAA